MATLTVQTNVELVEEAQCFSQCFLGQGLVSPSFHREHRSFGGMNGSAETYASVKQYYGAVLQKTTDLKTSACTAGKLLSFLGILLSYLSNITVTSCFVQPAGHMQRFEK